MNTLKKISLLFILVGWWSMLFGQLQGEDATFIKGGSYIPLYGNDTVAVTVGDFWIDRYPVTNSEFLTFVQDNPKWQKSKVIKLYAEENYLASWQSDTIFNASVLPNSPVTYVSWFAAKNYCQSLGKRLPTMDEWEYVAMADASVADARSDPNFLRTILEWYEKPTSKVIPEVGSTVSNYWGVYDMHGLVWEWVSDFNTVLISGESRKDVALDRNLFCAGASFGSTDPTNYAAFMRYAFRGSLEADYTLKNLGFRCAGNTKKEN